MVYKRPKLSGFSLSWLLALLLAALLTACSSNATLSPTPEMPTAEAVTATPAPTETPVPEQGRVLLVSDGTSALVDGVRQMLQARAAEAGWALEELPAMQTSDFTPGTKVAVFLTPPSNLAELLGVAGQTQLIVFSPTDLEASPNLSVIRVQPEQQAFVAGFVSIILAPDWRAAGLVPNDTPAGATIEQAFMNGGQYFCGICNPVYGPVVRFPLTATLSQASSPAEWQAAADELGQYNLYVVYVAPEASSPELLNSLAGKNYVLLGGGQVPPEEALPRWAGSIQIDALSALEGLWPGVAAGTGGQVASAPVGIVDANPDFLTEGRVQLVDEVLQGLSAGWLSPLDVPTE
ncbi:MAG: hypothetical protein VB089_19495 [Anaerolineaceae bacterium]|nr:hypothetical protein [Anaerolineaceae bacterium]